MAFTIAGLGNPGEGYENTRHNTGRIVLDMLRDRYGFPGWRKERSLKAFITEGEIVGEPTFLIEPDNYMNNSGTSVAPLVKKESAPDQLVVVYDDLDLGIGEFKISFGRGSGGHKGVESIAKEIGTKDFVRIRVGIAPRTLFGLPAALGTAQAGAVRKPKGEQKVHRFIMGKFTGSEQKKLEAIQPDIEKAIEMIVAEGREKAMSVFNK